MSKEHQLVGLCLAALACPSSLFAADPSPAPRADAGPPAAASQASPSPAVPPPPSRGTVTVRIQGLRHDRGTIYVALYDDPRTFEEKKGQRAGAVVRPRNRGAVVVFDDVRPGKYAVAFFQDENGNGKLDKSLFGAPTEPFGFSRDAMGRLGPPSFEAAAVRVPAGPLSVVINAKHL
jgi:uncharacterized protein (DUF2141 family)